MQRGGGETNSVCLTSLALTFISISVLTQKPLISLKPTNPFVVQIMGTHSTVIFLLG